jgi:mono/diheme cytochrome c family protein
MRTLLLLLALAAVSMAALIPAGAAAPASRARTTWDSVYTEEQATRGQVAYNRTCARCHLESLGGADESPALTGSAFLGNWNGLSLGEMHERVRKSMPTDDPGTYGRQLITDVIAYVLRANGFPAGKAELTHEGDALNAVQFSAMRP